MAPIATMFLKLHETLASDDLAAIRRVLESADLVDGTATGKATLKRNLQSPQGNPGLEDVTRQVVDAVTGRQEFHAYAAPQRVTVTFNRYDTGMQYKTHMDAAVMGDMGGKPMRTDLSFTLFLSEPADYEGGELAVETSLGEVRLKEAAGTAVVYPANMLHRIEPVTAGARLAAIGWVQSVLRHGYQRELMLDLYRLRAEIARDHPDSRYHERINRIKGNLMRSWAEI